MTSQWLDQEEVPMHFPKPNLHQKRPSSLFGGLLIHVISRWWSIWILVKPLHLRSMFSKLMRCTKNCHTYSRNWSIERAYFSPWQHPTTHCTTNASKFGLQSFASSAIFTWPLLPANQLLLLQASILTISFCKKTLPQLVGGRKCFPSVPQILTFTLQELTNISCWQNCADCNGFYFG